MLTTDKNVGGYLERAFAEGRVGHAYIVVGDKQYLAGLLTECAVVVMSPTHRAEENEITNRVASGQHQDVIVLPTDKSKNKVSVADAKKGNIVWMGRIGARHYQIAGPEGAVVTEYGAYHSNDNNRYTNPSVGF